MPQVDNKKIAKNTLYMYLRMLVTMVVSLFTTRIVFQALGVDNFGIYNIVGSIIVLFTFINNALSTATRRYITAELAQGKADSQREVFNNAVFSHIIIAGIIFLLGETVGLWAVNSLLNIPEERMIAANVVYQLSILSTILNVMQSPFTAAITAHERMNIYAYLSILDVVLKLAVAYVVMIASGDKLIVYGICIFTVDIVNILINRVYCYRCFPMCKYQKPRNRSLLKEMFGYMGWSLGGQFTNILTQQGVTVLVNTFSSVAVNAAMGISNQITKVVLSFVTSFQVAFHPQITKQYVSNNFEELNKLIIRTSRYSAYLVLIFLIPICCQIENFLGIWLGEYPQYSVEFCVLTLVTIYLEALMGPLWMLLISDKDIKKYQIIYSCISIFNFIGAWIFLLIGFPIYSVVIARIIVYIATLIARLLLSRERVNTFPMKEWLFHVAFKPLLISLIPFISYFFINKLNIVNNLFELFVKAGLVFFITCIVIFIWGFEQEERSFVIHKLKF